MSLYFDIWFITVYKYFHSRKVRYGYFVFQKKGHPKQMAISLIYILKLNIYLTDNG